MTPFDHVLKVIEEHANQTGQHPADVCEDAMESFLPDYREEAVRDVLKLIGIDGRKLH